MQRQIHAVQHGIQVTGQVDRSGLSMTIYHIRKFNSAFSDHYPDIFTG